MTADVLDRPLLADESCRSVIGMVSTWPPRQCGLATFAAALSRSMTDQGHEIVPVDVRPTGAPADHMALVAGDAQATRRAARILNACDAVIVQHEFGIFGGPDGIEVLDLLDLVDVPTVVVLHTVPANPTGTQAAILSEVCARADRVVVMGRTARERLEATYPDIDLTQVVVIVHGAAPATQTVRRRESHPYLLTWGLLGPGKGVEHVIEALSRLHARGEDVAYTIAGVTHPNVIASQGEAYRQMLMDAAERGGIAANVTFDSVYRTPEEVTQLAANSLAVVLPYDATDQVTSGVLVDALAAGRPVIATRFPHAVEMLSGGAGLVVPHRDPAALADAIHAVTTRPRLVARMTRRAQAIAPTLSWSAVAREYGRLCASLVGARV